ncbi:unknown protein [Desulfotalea psychrophila LSv54]|uniref:Uncharacterized protein n=1 Tax=Desulfotalea psychrophila (strain LSv54 / DSM 12343) TaxID=177439 RepID=Q6AJH3_DESPS|nr:unknown protein [Desulfotalea psychrophila LSv54]
MRRRSFKALLFLLVAEVLYCYFLKSRSSGDEKLSFGLVRAESFIRLYLGLSVESLREINIL